FEKMAEISGDARWAAVVIAEVVKSLRRKNYHTSKLTDEKLVELARLYRDKRFYREGTVDILKTVCKNNHKISEVIDEVIFKVPSEEFEIIADELIYDEKGPEEPEKRIRYFMGLTMRKYRGAIPGKLLFDKISAREKNKSQVHKD
ncbi:MAG: hypothetical protein GF307_00225, partial [candidate division Zixibacteria bacterium]|nr:hypothetical protein [candidate division Zixibacteria bacterium]